MFLKIINYIKVRFRKWLNEEIWIEDYLRQGMKIGNNCNINSGFVADYFHAWLIEIGNNVTIAPDVYLLAHDTSTKRSIDYVRIGKIKIGDNCFIGARTIVMPNVEIGNNTIVGANSTVTKSFPADVVIAGSPAKIIATLDDYEKKNNLNFKKSLKFDEFYTLRYGISNTMKQEMIDRIIIGNNYYIK